jgi:peroxiredoxin Q/BCP
MAKSQRSRVVPRNSSPSGSSTGSARDTIPQVGAKAPNFRFARDDGQAVSLADFAGHKLVLYFYPRANTSGCTKEALDFSRLKAAFTRAKTEILGVSASGTGARSL